MITAIGWVGSSHHVTASDGGLPRDRTLDRGADGERWQVRGGGFYRNR
ncbi:MAG TPA: urate hydroxylase PuuD, partial [Tabrizicola sp.]|nr:urate hydroxylase PuuD [Tabrizicola sp.]